MKIDKNYFDTKLRQSYGDLDSDLNNSCDSAKSAVQTRYSNKRMVKLNTEGERVSNDYDRRGRSHSLRKQRKPAERTTSDSRKSYARVKLESMIEAANLKTNNDKSEVSIQNKIHEIQNTKRSHNVELSSAELQYLIQNYDNSK